MRTTDKIESGGVEPLWHAFSAPLRGFLRARTKTDSDADDLLQEVFIRIHKRLPALRDTARIQGWIYRIARNVVTDHYRSRREHSPIDFDPESEPADEGNLVDLRPTLQRFLAELPEPYRQPLLRHEYQGKPIKEVAVELGLTVTATKSRVQRARQLLREMLDRCCRFDFDRRGRVIEAIPRTVSSCRCK